MIPCRDATSGRIVSCNILDFGFYVYFSFFCFFVQHLFCSELFKRSLFAVDFYFASGACNGDQAFARFGLQSDLSLLF